jgi:uncharacterized protein (UPF0333 family)
MAEVARRRRADMAFMLSCGAITVICMIVLSYCIIGTFESLRDLEHSVQHFVASVESMARRMESDAGRE